MIDPLLAYPMTTKERRSVALVRRLTGWSETGPFPSALEYVRIFYWHIRTAPGGAEGLLKRQGIVR